MRRPRALSLFCCSGGDTVGLERAGFDVIGIDHKPSNHWQGRGELHEADLSTADAVAAVIEAFRPDFVSSSPPCQVFSSATPSAARKRHVNLIPSTREGILRAGVPGWIENVETVGRHFTGFWIMLCGSMFPETYHLQRHRRFELHGWRMTQPWHSRAKCRYADPAHEPCDLCRDLAPSPRRVAVAGNGPPDAAQSARYKRGRNGAREVVSVAGDGSGNRGRGPRRNVVTIVGDGGSVPGLSTNEARREWRRRTLTLAGNQGEGLGQLCGQNRAGPECIRWRIAMNWIDGPRDRYSLRQAVPPIYAETLGRAFLATRPDLTAPGPPAASAQSPSRSAPAS